MPERNQLDSRLRLSDSAGHGGESPARKRVLEVVIDPTRGNAERELYRYRRLFNRLEAAISHHKKAHHTAEDDGLYFADDPDYALWKARDKILKDACEGRG